MPLTGSDTQNVCIISGLTQLFDVWLLAACKPQSSLCPVSGQGDKKSWVLPLWHRLEIQSMQNICEQHFTPGQSSNHNENPGQAPFLAFLSHFGPPWEACPAHLRDLDCVSNKSWLLPGRGLWHQSQQTNKILGRDSSCLCRVAIKKFVKDF